MKKLLSALMLGAACLLTPAAYSETVVVDTYKFRMSIYVPRTFDNMSSLGYRKYQRQTVEGELKIEYVEEGRSSISITNLMNKTHKISGKNITYACLVDNDGEVGPITRVNLIGSNKTQLFYTPSVVFYLDAEPSYNIGEDDEDNSLLVTLAGHGSTAYNKTYKTRIIKTLSGSVAGTLGCGCRAYGHVSPTRVAGMCGATSFVDDVASVHGSWRAAFKSRQCVCK